MKKVIFLKVLLTIFINGHSQNIYEQLKERVAQIGIVSNNEFFVVGSSLVCYIPIEGRPSLTCIVTARHVLNYFLENRMTEVYIRPSWADSIKTTNWFGVKSPLYLDGFNPTYFTPSDTNIDLACIVMVGKNDTVIQSYYKNHSLKMQDYNSIKNPELGDKIVVAGYPDHVDNVFRHFHYSVCTIKEGNVSWVSDIKIDSKIIDNFILIESTATHGNSGGPVFDIAAPPTIKLIGIVSGGWPDDTQLPLMSDTNKVVDPNTNRSLYVISKSSVVTIVKADLIKKLLENVRDFINNDVKSSKKQ
jgi:hypothetical protein